MVQYGDYDRKRDVVAELNVNKFMSNTEGQREGESRYDNLGPHIQFAFQLGLVGLRRGK